MTNPREKDLNITVSVKDMCVRKDGYLVCANNAKSMLVMFCCGIGFILDHFLLLKLLNTWCFM